MSWRSRPAASKSALKRQSRHAITRPTFGLPQRDVMASAPLEAQVLALADRFRLSLVREIEPEFGLCSDILEVPSPCHMQQVLFETCYRTRSSGDSILSKLESLYVVS